jgi:aspartate racemase
MDNKIIGIIGGVGPFAGLDLFKKIFHLTNASSDQQHLDVLLHSLPGQIPDRTDFLTGIGKVNPAIGLFDVVCKLNASSASIVGLPCNTSHAADIWNPLSDRVAANFPHISLVNMVEEVGIVIAANHAENSKIGIMATTGTVVSKLYDAPLKLHGMIPVYPDDDVQCNYIHDAIYNKNYGIKALSDPTTIEVDMKMSFGLDHLIDKGVAAIILGCTEVPLSVKEKSYKDIPLYDSTLILAEKLVRLANPLKLK